MILYEIKVSRILLQTNKQTSHLTNDRDNLFLGIKFEKSICNIVIAKQVLYIMIISIKNATVGDSVVFNAIEDNSAYS